MGGETGQSSPPLLCPDQWEQQSECQLRIPRWLAGAKDRGAASWPRGSKACQELAGSVPALVPGFCGWPWVEGDPQGVPDWVGGGLGCPEQPSLTV